MSDITEAAVQDEIATSLLDAPIVGSWKDSTALTDLQAEPQEQSPESAQENEAQIERFVSDEAARRNAAELANLETDRERDNPEIGEQPQSAERQELTPQQIQEGMQSLDTTVKEHGLNDPARASEFAAGLCAAFETDPYREGVNVEALGNVAAKTVLSAANIYQASGGDMSKLRDIPEASARAFTHEFLASFGVDPRTVQADHQALARTVLGATLNILDTYNRTGISDLTRLNDPQVAEFYANSFLRAFGVNAPVTREFALKMADAFGSYVLSSLAKYQQIQPKEQPQGRRSGGRQPSRRGFRSNADIFSDDVLERLELERVGSGSDKDFEPKPRAPRSRFRTNSDLFDEETVNTYSGRIL